MRWSAASENASLTSRVILGEQSFTAEELTRLHLMLRMVVLNAQAVSQHFEAGLIDIASFDAAILSFKLTWLTNPIYRALWVQQAPWTSPSFRKTVEDMLREVAIATPVDIVASFKDDLSKVLAQGAVAPALGSAEGSNPVIGRGS